MTNDAILTIAGMALVTYLVRAGGLVLMSRVTLSKRVMAWLHQIPGAVLIAIVAPGILTGGISQIVSGLATILVMWYTKSLLAALLTGVATIWILRTFGGF